MADGCAAVSLKAMRQVADMLNETVTPCAMEEQKACGIYGQLG